MDAAVVVAATLGLAANDVIVLHNSNRLTVRLLPADLLARVAFVGGEAATFEVAIARRLADDGCPTGVLDRRVAPRVYERDGFAVTFWTYYEPAVSRVRSADYAEALERLHLGMRSLDVPTPHFTDRVASAERIIAERHLSPDLLDDDRDLLTTTLQQLDHRIRERKAPEQLLHGEPHPGNVLGTASGPLFIDLETCCRGPVEFDLAHVPEAVSRRYPGIDSDLLRDGRQLVLAMVAAWRWELGDQLPNGKRAGRDLVGALRAGPPWPTLDEVFDRLDATSDDDRHPPEA